MVLRKISKMNHTALGTRQVLPSALLRGYSAWSHVSGALARHARHLFRHVSGHELGVTVGGCGQIFGLVLPGARSAAFHGAAGRSLSCEGGRPCSFGAGAVRYSETDPVSVGPGLLRAWRRQSPAVDAATGLQQRRQGVSR